jgi:hypothetical protein
MPPVFVAVDFNLRVLLQNWVEAIAYQAIKIQTSG